MITGEELGRALFEIHTHAGLLLKYEHLDNEESLMINANEIVYREKDLIETLKKLGLPEPVWRNDKIS